MATRAVASAVFPLPIEKVWKELRDFTFPGKYFSTIQEAKMEDGVPPTTVGAIRTLVWKTGETRYGYTAPAFIITPHFRKHRLIEVSDQHYRLVWELVECMLTHLISL